MKIYEKSVRNPISTFMIAVGMLVLGLFSFQRLPVDLMPDMDIPILLVMTVYPGAGAAEIEASVTIPLENSLTTVSNLRTLSSTSSDNISTVMLQFEWGTDIDVIANDVRDLLGRAEGNLPDGADRPLMLKLDMNMMPIVRLAVTAEESFLALENILEDRVIPRLNRIDGVGSVDISGAVTREVQVNLDPMQMEALNLTLEQIGQTIAMANVNIPSGTMNIGTGTFTVSTQGEFTSSSQIENLVVSRPGTSVVRLSEVATVLDTIAETTQEMRMDGERGVELLIRSQSGGNTVAIANAVLAELPYILRDLPDDVNIEVAVNTADHIERSISSLGNTIMFAFIFVTLVVLFFLGNWRATFIVVVTIPISLVAAFIYLMVTNESLNIISLSSLVIGLTLVVDNSIVVLENIMKHIERGSSPREAAIYGTNEVWLAIIASTLVLLAVFLPLTMIGGMAGILFTQLGWIIAIVVIASTVVSVTLTPMLAAKMLKFQTDKKENFLSKRIEKILNATDNGYAKMLTWSVRNRAKVMIGGLAIFVASIMLLRFVPVEFMPQSDDSQITVSIELEQGRGLEYTTAITARVTDHIMANFPELEMISTTTGAASGAGMGAFFGPSGPHAIDMTMRFTSASQRDRSTFEMADLIRDYLESIPQIVNSTVNAGRSVGFGGGDIEVKIFGHDFHATENFARQLLAEFEQIEGTRDVQLSRDDMKLEYRVVFDVDKLGHYGLNVATAGTFIRNRINGMTASILREEGNEIDIVVRYDEPFRNSIEDIENIRLFGSGGHVVRVRDVGVVEEFFSPPSIQREDRQRVIAVEMSLHDVALGDVVPQIYAVISQAGVPDGMHVIVGGAAEDQAEAFADIGLLLLLVILLVYIVMATQFESFRTPFIIMFTLPFAFTGVFLALFITNTPLSLIALIGSVMLVGIVVKNGVVLLDFANLMRDRGLTINQSVITAGKSRLRPVLMTSITTILGMMPMAIGLGEGAETWQPMGIAIIGGLIVSTILTLIVIPVLYSLFGGRSILAQKRALRIIQADEE
ncbi:MAG: efflux RND transporter permease subunit [Bacteroidales bacterium]|nr:efflux RND transporter permease subunit [Bacteroidales bacterium]